MRLIKKLQSHPKTIVTLIIIMVMTYWMLHFNWDIRLITLITLFVTYTTNLMAGIASLIGLIPIIGPLIVKIFKDGQKKYGSRAWSSMIVKRMEDLNKIDFRAKGFPNELIDNEPEEKGYEI